MNGGVRGSGRHDKVLHGLYQIGIWFKGIDGILEVIGGFLFLLVSKAALNRLVVVLTQHELTEDHTDWIATHLRHAVSHLSASTKLFGSAYLLGHGAIKVFLVWGGLLRRRLWAFPSAIAFLGAFICYQVYRMAAQRFSLALAVLTVIDVFVVLLIWREYHVIKTAGSTAHSHNAAAGVWRPGRQTS